MASLLSYALTNLADVKESLAIASSDHSYDNLIIRKINQATRQIEGYCNRRFLETTYENEEYNATQIDSIVLKNYPITSKQAFSAQVRQSGLNEDDWEDIPTDYYFVDTDSGVINSDFRFRGYWKAYRFTYSAGYETIPDDLAEACADLAAYYVINADTSNINVTLKQEGQRKVQYGGTGKLTFEDLCSQLGIDETLNSYAANPVYQGK